VALDPGKTFLLGPASVTVHDHGDMSGQTAEIDLEKEVVLLCPGGEILLEVLLHWLLIISWARLDTNAIEVNVPPDAASFEVEQLREFW